MRKAFGTLILALVGATVLSIIWLGGAAFLGNEGAIWAFFLGGMFLRIPVLFLLVILAMIGGHLRNSGDNPLPSPRRERIEPPLKGAVGVRPATSGSEGPAGEQSTPKATRNHTIYGCAGIVLGALFLAASVRHAVGLTHFENAGIFLLMIIMQFKTLFGVLLILFGLAELQHVKGIRQTVDDTFST
ncbi:hypothetical protein Z945_1563 [Sulfitobacter noctilucae]|uniref:hypothetical protein n=1 Tax=Sulfitobacter noctilucae TaxID=1342302 RepID=UPI0004692AC1|nr:hypothetical protein [Sulfitobacter noctilucae]KIN60588.1 hypothetical protein Z945_1563 [Sulfitobacter noctilucae]